jgi:hypothetical protein
VQVARPSRCVNGGSRTLVRWCERSRTEPIPHTSGAFATCACGSRPWRPRLSLVVGAPEPESFLARGTLLVPPDYRPAAPTRLACASVHPAVPAGPGVAGGGMAEAGLVGVKQPLPELNQGVEVLDRADRTRRVNVPQVQRPRQVPRPMPPDSACSFAHLDRDSLVQLCCDLAAHARGKEPVPGSALAPQAGRPQRGCLRGCPP